MQTPDAVTKLLIEYLYVDEAEQVRQICIVEIPSTQPVPEVGDEISIPEGMGGETRNQ